MHQKAGIRSNVLARMEKDEYISLESVEKICYVLNCRTEDMLEFIPEGDK